MPVTQRFAMFGLVLAAVVLGTSLTLLAFGAHRTKLVDQGMEGSIAPDFTLSDFEQKRVHLYDPTLHTVVLIFTERDCQKFSSRQKIVNSIVHSHDENTDVSVLGVQFESDAPLLGPSQRSKGVMEDTIPGLRVLIDPDGTVARSYRINDCPIAIIIQNGQIKKRIPLDNDSSSIVCNQYIDSLRGNPVVKTAINQ